MSGLEKSLTFWADLAPEMAGFGEKKNLLDLLELVHLQPTYKHIQLWEMFSTSFGQETPKESKKLLCVSLLGRHPWPHDGSVPVASLWLVDPPSIAKPFGPLHRSPLNGKPPGKDARSKPGRTGS